MIDKRRIKFLQAKQLNRYFEYIQSFVKYNKVMQSMAPQGISFLRTSYLKYCYYISLIQLQQQNPNLENSENWFLLNLKIVIQIFLSLMQSLAVYEISIMKTSCSFLSIIFNEIKSFSRNFTSYYRERYNSSVVKIDISKVVKTKISKISS